MFEEPRLRDQYERTKQLSDFVGIFVRAVFSFAAVVAYLVTAFEIYANLNTAILIKILFISILLMSSLMFVVIFHILIYGIANLITSYLTYRFEEKTTKIIFLVMNNLVYAIIAFMIAAPVIFIAFQSVQGVLKELIINNIEFFKDLFDINNTTGIEVGKLYG